MNLFLLNVLLAFAWAVVNGSPAPRDVAVGFVLAFFILWLVSPERERATYHGRLLRVIPFAVWYLGELVRCNVRVARDVLTPTLRNRPGIVAVPLDCETDAEITAAANLVSLTPGTLSLSVSRDRSKLYVHCMDVDPQQLDRVLGDFKDGIERRVLSISRPAVSGVDSREEAT
ncbi:MAG: Na+/H+ antiporter subunit E [Planctomycetota bacterium]